MHDNAIIDLYWKRDESAIVETETKYGRYLTKISYNVLFDLEDSKESVADTYLRAWCRKQDILPAAPLEHLRY